MDPLSITASALAVLGAARASMKKVADYHDASRELESLLSELDRVYKTVKSIDSCFTTDLESPHTVDIILSMENIVARIQHIRDIAPHNHCTQRKRASHHERFNWVLKKHTLTALRDELRIARFDLILHLNLIQTVRLGQIESNLKKLTLADDVNTAEELTRSGETGMPDLSTECSVQDGGLSASPIDPKDNSSIIWQKENPAKPWCKAWCSCVCHSQTILTTPSSLQWILGNLRLRAWYAGLPCNERSCHRSGSMTMSAEFHLPVFLTRRCIVLRMSDNPLGGPQFSLKMPRVMGWSHLLWKYAQNNQKDAILRLFSEQKASPADVNQQGSNALIYTVDNLDLTKLLLREKADPYIGNSYGRSAAELLWERAFVGRYGSEGPHEVSIILQDQDYIDAQGFSVLHKIVLGLIPRDLRAELESSTAYMNIGDFRSRTPLCWASMRNDIEAVRILLEFGASPNIKDDLGHTCLDWVEGSKVCRLLLEANADAKSRNRTRGRSALHRFCARGKPLVKDSSEDAEVIDRLIGAGIDVNEKDWDEETPLHRAVFTGRNETAEILLSRGADPSIANVSSRNNAMHIAVAFDCFAIIPTLIARGADYTATSKSGRTIAHYAARSAGTRAVQILADANLVGLNFHLRDQHGKTAIDEIAERVALQDTEEGIHEAFDRFVASVRAHPMSTDGIDEEKHATVVQAKAMKSLEIRLPGAFPD